MMLRTPQRRLRHAAYRWRIRKPIWQKSLTARLHGRKVVHFLHVGKTGGTALKYVLRNNRDTPTHLVMAHPHKVQLRDLPPWDDFFFFLRDPVDRYVSGFNSRLREGRPRYVRPWTSREKWAFERFQTAEELAVALGSDDPRRRAQAQRAMRSIRHVRSGFATWTGDPRLFRRRQKHLVLVGRLETIDADFERLKALLSLPADAALPQHDKHAHRDPGSAPRHLSPEARENVAAWYSEDYRFLAASCALDPGRTDHDLPPPAEDPRAVGSLGDALKRSGSTADT